MASFAGGTCTAGGVGGRVHPVARRANMHAEKMMEKTGLLIIRRFMILPPLHIGLSRWTRIACNPAYSDAYRFLHECFSRTRLRHFHKCENPVFSQRIGVFAFSPYCPHTRFWVGLILNTAIYMKFLYHDFLSKSTTSKKFFGLIISATGCVPRQGQISHA